MRRRTVKNACKRGLHDQGFTRNGRGHSCTNYASAPQPHAPQSSCASSMAGAAGAGAGAGAGGGAAPKAVPTPGGCRYTTMAVRLSARFPKHSSPLATLALKNACTCVGKELVPARFRFRLLRPLSDDLKTTPCYSRVEHTRGETIQGAVQSRSDGEWGCGEGPCETRTDNRVTLTDRDTEGKVRSLFYDLTLSPLYATRPKQ